MHYPRRNVQVVLERGTEATRHRDVALPRSVFIFWREEKNP